MSGHAANILALLDAQRCVVCGGPAVRGARVCLPCAAKEEPVNANWPKPGTPERIFLDAAVTAAQACQRATGVPACITLAQSALESGMGAHHCGSGNNYFGIKADLRWRGPYVEFPTTEWSRARGYYPARARFRKYPSMAESFIDHGQFLRKNRRYAGLFRIPPDDYRGWARGIKAAGYATDPRYPKKLTDLIERYGFQYYNLAA